PRSRCSPAPRCNCPCKGRAVCMKGSALNPFVDRTSRSLFLLRALAAARGSSFGASAIDRDLPDELASDVVALEAGTSEHDIDVGMSMECPAGGISSQPAPGGECS